MKKLICAILCLIMLLSLAIPALAADDVIVFADNSKFEFGGTARVDTMKTLYKIMDLGKSSEEYNAALEGNVEYVWYRDGLSWGYGESYTFEDYGEYFCRVYLYEDAEHSKRCGYYTSQTFTIAAKIPEITTKSIPNGKVGESYYCRLECTDADVVFDLYQSSLPDGMYITQHGEIEGTPTKAGNYHINVIATPEAGEDYATIESYDFTIEEAGPSYTIEIMELPKKLTYTAGEKLDMTGLRVRIWMPDGYMDSKDGDKLTYSQKALVTLGEQKIALRYEDAFDIFYVTVVAAPEKPTEAPTEATTEVTAAPTEETTVAPPDAPTGDVEDPGTKPSEDVGVDAPLGSDGVTTTGPNSGTDNNLPGEGGGNPAGNTWILWVVIGILAAVLVVAAVVIILLVVKRKKG